MKIPERITIGGFELAVEKQAVNVMGNERGSHLTGYGRILIAREVPEDYQSECFLHEIMEFIKHENNLDIDHQSLSTLSTQIFAAIRQNALDFRKDAVAQPPNAPQFWRCICNRTNDFGKKCDCGKEFCQQPAGGAVIFE